MFFVAVAWKVPPSMNAQRLSRALARASISFDEARAKVRRRFFSGGTPFWPSIAARRVKVLVLPAPGPARITAGPSRLATAFAWPGFSYSRRCPVLGLRVLFFRLAMALNDEEGRGG